MPTDEETRHTQVLAESDLHKKRMMVAIYQDRIGRGRCLCCGLRVLQEERLARPESGVRQDECDCESSQRVEAGKEYARLQEEVHGAGR